MPIYSSTITDLVSNKAPQPHYRFDGSDDIINLGNISGTFDHATIISISCWIRTTATSATIISDESASGFAGVFFLYVQNDGTILWRRGNGASGEWNFEGTKTVNDDQWHHIVGIDSGTALSLYIDGVANGAAGSGGYSAAGASGRDVMIGRLARSASGGFFKGEISNISIYSVALSSSEIGDLYAGRSPSWKYRGASSTNLVDADASTMDSGTHYWIGYPDYTMSNVSNQIRITDGGGGTMLGAYNYLRDSYDLSTDLTVGKKYNARIDASYTGGNAPGMQINGAIEGNQDVNLTTSLTTHNFFFTANTAAGSFIRTYNMNNSQYVTIDNFKMYRVGLLAEWDGSGISSDKWFDKSGNNLHGTVSGATVENAPSGDDGLVYEEGTWTPVATSYDGATEHGEANYTRIGNMCYATCKLGTASSGAVNDGSHVIISGLPYNAISGQTGWGGFVTRFPGGGVLSYHMHKQGDNDRFAFYDGGGADVTYNELGWDTNSKSLYITIMYQIN